jgi:hypothetical protein
MHFGRWIPIGFAALISVWNLPAQQPAPPPAPNFDVVSIHLAPPNTPPTLRDVDFTPILPGGRHIDSRANLFLASAVEPIEYWFVEHVEPPTEN